MPPSLAPEWTWHLDGEPLLVRALPPGTNAPASIVVALKPDRLLVIAGDGHNIIGQYRAAEPIGDVSILLPGPASNLPSAASIVVGAGRTLTALDPDLHRQWSALLPPRYDDAIRFLRTGDVNHDGAPEVIALDDRAVYIYSAQGRLLRDFEREPSQAADVPDFPRQVEIAQLDPEHGPELIVLDERSIQVTSSMSEARYQFPVAPGPALDTPGQVVRRFAVGDVDGDGTAEILILNPAVGASWLLCLSGVTFLGKWVQSLPLPESAGFALLRIVGHNVYSAAVLPHGGCLLCRQDSLGRVRTSIRAEAGYHIRRILDLTNCGSLVLLALEPEELPGFVRVFPADLSLEIAEGLGYSGVRIIELLPARIDGDDRPDLAVIRQSPSGRNALDVFHNNLGTVQNLVDRALLDFRAALRAGATQAIRRIGRRSLLLARHLGTAAEVEALLNQGAGELSRRENRTRLFYGLAALAVLAGLAVLTVFILRRKPWRRRSRLPRFVRSAPQLMDVCNEIISLDHLFVAKGNVPGALNRLRAVALRCGLTRDPDLSALSDRLEPHYSRFIFRLISEPKTVNLVNLVETIAREVAPRDKELKVVQMTKQQFESQFGFGRGRQSADGHWLVKIQNWDRPAIYQDFRIFHDVRTERYFEHWLVDNFRYARGRSAVIFDYSVNTAWNRKMSLRFTNDSPNVVDLARPHSNLATQLQELSHAYGSFIEIARDEEDLDSDVKLWLRFWDFISILEDIYQRQSQTASL